jgi:nucleoid-associated protein YgaU
MFKKRHSIEDDYLRYNSDENIDKNPNQTSILATIIKLLIILLLLMLFTFGVLFGYKFLTKKEKSEQASNNTQQFQKEKKLYTQEEMQAIIQTMMENLQKSKIEDSPKQESVSNETELIQSLEDIEVIDIKEDLILQEIPSLQNTPEAIVTNEISKNPIKENKVVLNNQPSSYNNIDEISSEIKKVMEEMSHKKTIVKTSYTQSIAKEVHTRENEMRVIIVKKGDSLSKIAKRAYGSAMAYDKIFQANPDLIKNPNHIYVGQRLRVPLSN